MVISHGYEAAQSRPAMTSQELDLLQADRPGYGNRSVLAVALNIVNATVGAGVIGLPLALLYAGFINGIVLSIVVGLLTYTAIYCLVLAGQHVGVYKFAAMGDFAMGRTGFHMVNLMLFIQSAGSCVSYFILVADTIPGLLGLYLPGLQFLADRQRTTILISMFVIFPLNLPRSIGALASWSALSVLLLPIMILSVLIRAPAYAPYHEAPLSWFGQDPFAALGIMSFSLVCSQVSFSNFLSLRDQSAKAWRNASSLSVFMSWTVSITFAVIGYLCFGKDVESNIFANFPVDDDIINVGRLALGISMVLTVPMAFYPARDALQKTLGFESADRQPTPLQHYAVSFLLFIVLLGFGVTVHSLGKVYSTVGGIASSFLAFIMPGAAYLAAFKPWRGQETRYEQEPLLATKSDQTKHTSLGLSLVCVVLVVFGTVVMAMTVINSFR